MFKILEERKPDLCDLFGCEEGGKHMFPFLIWRCKIPGDEVVTYRPYTLDKIFARLVPGASKFLIITYIRLALSTTSSYFILILIIFSKSALPVVSENMEWELRCGNKRTPYFDWNVQELRAVWRSNPSTLCWES